MSFDITAMTAGDLDEVRELWDVTEGIGLNDANTHDGLRAYLRKNPGLSLVAPQNGELKGVVLCGHDRRRGYLHHLAIRKAHRRMGLGTILVDRCMAKLGSLGLNKCNIFVYEDNDRGSEFWRNGEWIARPTWKVMQRETNNE